MADGRGIGSGFGSLLVANRGEIALRVMRTARRLGLRTIAVYSEADRDARHAREADAAACIGEGPPRESYLKIESLIAAARRTGVSSDSPIASRTPRATSRSVRSACSVSSPPANGTTTAAVPAARMSSVVL